MTEPSNLRDAAEVWDDAIAAWSELLDDGADIVDMRQAAAAIIEADRAAVEAATIAKVVAWLRMLAILRAMQNPGQLADAIEAGEWKQ